MKNLQHFIGVIFLALFLWSPSLAETTPYSTDFSTDPGWTTDQPSNYYWDSATQTYHVRAENHYPGYKPSRYSYHLLPESVGSFRLTWDVQPTRTDWSAGIFFGVYDDNLLTAGIDGGQSIQAGPCNPDAGFLWYFRVDGAGGIAETSSSAPSYTLNQWYTCELTYDAPASMVGFEVKESGASGAFWTANLAVPVGGFTNDLKYLGTARGGIGDNGTYPGLSEWAVAEGNIDNVSLQIPAPGALLLGSIGIGLVNWLRRSRTI